MFPMRIMSSLRDLGYGCTMRLQSFHPFGIIVIGGFDTLASCARYSTTEVSPLNLFTAGRVVPSGSEERIETSR